MAAGSRKLKMTMIADAAALAYARFHRSAALTRVSKTAICNKSWIDMFNPDICLSVSQALNKNYTAARYATVQQQ
jgi:hypothetical protein